MKKIIYVKYAVLSILLVSLLPSCTNEIDDAFDKSSSERTADALSHIREVLIDAPMGWAVSYYPDASVYGGFNYLMRFNADGSVEMQGDKVTEDKLSFVLSEEPSTSQYSVKASQGPVLSFDTYCLVSQLADPTSLANYYGPGLRGDNEFVWRRTSVNKDTIVFTGVRRDLDSAKDPLASSEIVFIKNASNWNTHLDAVQTHRTAFSQGNYLNYFKEVRLTDGSSIVMAGFDNIERSVYGIDKNDGGEIIFQDRTGLSMTEKGLLFKNGLNIGGHKVKSFDYDGAVFRIADADVQGQLNGISQPSFVFEGTQSAVLMPNVSYIVNRFSPQIRVPLQAAVNKLNYLGLEYYAFVLIPSGTSGHTLAILHRVGANTVDIAAQVTFTYIKSSERSDKIRFTQGRTISVSGAYGQVVNAEMREIANVISDTRNGQDYIIMPDKEQINYTFGSCSSSNYFSANKW